MRHIPSACFVCIKLALPAYTILSTALPKNKFLAVAVKRIGKKMTTSIIQLFALVAGFSTAVFAATQAGSTAAEKPKILWIVTEDIGCDMTCYGARVRTSLPNNHKH
jgi:hypothetical protein